MLNNSAVLILLIGIFVLLVLPACGGVSYYYVRRWRRKVKALEKELRDVSETLLKMAEHQVKAYRRLTGNIEDIEERMTDMTTPVSESRTSLDRRHNILVLARKGMEVGEIARRLKIPRGEVELTLTLRKYGDRSDPRLASVGEGGRNYAQA